MFDTLHFVKDENLKVDKQSNMVSVELHNMCMDKRLAMNHIPKLCMLNRSLE